MSAKLIIKRNGGQCSHQNDQTVQELREWHDMCCEVIYLQRIEITWQKVGGSSKSSAFGRASSTYNWKNDVLGLTGTCATFTCIFILFLHPLIITFTVLILVKWVY